MGNRRRGCRRGSRRRPHRPCTRRCRDDASRSRRRKDPQSRTTGHHVNWLTTLLRRPRLGVWDIVDILVVSILIYEVLKLIRGTRAVQMALGAAFLVLLFYGSRWSHLETVNWLVRNLVGYIVFAVIVLFQSDIRRALAHLGRGPFFRYFAKAESAEESIEELVVAANMLSSQRIGAIVAIERQIGLRNYIEGGIPLDAVLTYDLLLAIFHSDSPLHDGAVIVQDDRVAAAACFLPLTVNPKLSKELGSRHRAAIGLTEENDSVAIVVSEETGKLSIVADGQIERGLSPDELRARLRALVLQKPTSGAAREEMQYT
ncbi:MAG: TIGR00159 family protein [Acidobacteria bacterium]|nr:MAG: TIGR00159 family protein [Acidobacteriota bacterium]PYQ88438.1 MAG: TIGR00159 family protein [Acidobacteriota bacterium]PYR11865.1 MAG: TIGR00159 family protein [Acidobacteriota bacterium]PYR13591.1 MAG: TIGR00159 family protein [Acidobacteriota bacterium]